MHYFENLHICLVIIDANKQTKYLLLIREKNYTFFPISKRI